MKRLILPIVIASCVAAASVLAGPVKQRPAPKKQKPKDAWYKILIGGKPGGYLHEVVTYEQYEGRRIKRDVTEMHMFLGRRPMRHTLTCDGRYELDGRLIKQRWTSIFEALPALPGEDVVPDKREMEVAIKNGVLTAGGDNLVGEGKVEKKIVLAKGTKVYVEVDGWLLKRHGIGPGDVAEFDVFSFETLKLEKESVKKIERIKYVHEGKKVDAFRVTIGYPWRLVKEGTIIMTTDYETLKIVFGGIVLVRSNKKDALANVPPAVQVEIEDDILDE